MVDYSSNDYWDQRFGKDVSVFEWLKKPEELISQLLPFLESIRKEDRRILHIGSGSSTLSLYLRDFVERPKYIHNIDFSHAGLELGRKTERESMATQGLSAEKIDDDELMIWTKGDLLSVTDVISLQHRTSEHGLYSLVVDKSTSDAIACGNPVEIQPSLFDANAGTEENLATIPHNLEIYPVWLLALHMAAITAPEALWIAVSYKEDRFWFTDRSFLPVDLKGQTVPQALLPSTYWTLYEKTMMLDKTPELTDTSSSSVVHRPATGQWLLVLKRTNKRLSLKPEA